VYFTATAATFVLPVPPAQGSTTPQAEAVTLQLVGANSAAQATGSGLLPTKTNYFVGNDPSQWHSNVANYGSITFPNVYRGINLTWHGNAGQQLESDFTVAPGANASAIQFQVPGATSLSVDANGNLVIGSANGNLVEQAPILYQVSGGAKVPVSGGYTLLGN